MSECRVQRLGIHQVSRQKAKRRGGSVTVSDPEQRIFAHTLSLPSTAMCGKRTQSARAQGITIGEDGCNKRAEAKGAL